MARGCGFGAFFLFFRCAAPGQGWRTRPHVPLRPQRPRSRLTGDPYREVPDRLDTDAELAQPEVRVRPEPPRPDRNSRPPCRATGSTHRWGRPALRAGRPSPDAARSARCSGATTRSSTATPVPLAGKDLGRSEPDAPWEEIVCLGDRPEQRQITPRSKPCASLPAATSRGDSMVASWRPQSSM